MLLTFNKQKIKDLPLILVVRYACAIKTDKSNQRSPHAPLRALLIDNLNVMRGVRSGVQSGTGRDTEKNGVWHGGGHEQVTSLSQSEALPSSFSRSVSTPKMGRLIAIV